MFNFFGGGKNYSVGIDFGTSAIKVIELSRKNQKISLENYGWVDLGLNNPSTISKPAAPNFQLDYNKKLQKYLEKLIKSLKLKSNSAYISLPGFSGLITIIEFPDMNEEELEEAIKFEARKYIPISLDEVALDWEIIGKIPVKSEQNAEEKKPVEIQEIKKEEKREGEKKAGIMSKNLGGIFSKSSFGKHSLSDGKNEILLVAAPKSEVMRCGNIVKEAGLEVKNVELELFSLARALSGDDPGCFLIIDIGARITNIILVEKGVIKVNRNVEGGGIEITNIIAESLNISKQRAEELKKEDEDIINSKEMSLTIPVLDMIANESVRIVDALKEKKSALRVDGVILSGGSSKLKGLDKYFQQKIGIQTSVGNPWRKVVFNDKLNPFVKKMGNSFSVALGLAFRGLEEIDQK
ncbi:MAG: pilus assembly protein PilM [bacterium]|nr:pilus assembly protein PilM [bacterium]